MLCALSAQADQITGDARVVDGDSLRVAGLNIRLFGIDAPERDQTCVTDAGVRWDCGAQVTRLVRQQLRGKVVTCDLRDKDDFDRDLAVCFVEGGT